MIYILKILIDVPGWIEFLLIALTLEFIALNELHALVNTLKKLKELV